METSNGENRNQVDPATLLVFKCEVCKIAVNSEGVLESHKLGKQHLRNVELIHQGESPVFRQNKRKTPQSKLPSTEASKLIAECSVPIIGLDYVTEHSKEGEPEMRYICDLCDSKLLLGNLIPHVTGIKHRREYMKKICPEVLEEREKAVENPTKKSEKGPIVTDLALELMQKYGKGTMKIKKVLDPFYTPPNPNQKLAKPRGGMGGGRGGYGNEGGRGRGRGGAGRGSYEDHGFSDDYDDSNRFASVYSNFGPPAKKTRLEGTIHHVADIVLNNPNLLVTEEDASLALQVSNFLTNALLQYRLSSSEADSYAGGHGSANSYGSGSGFGKSYSPGKSYSGGGGRGNSGGGGRGNSGVGAGYSGGFGGGAKGFSGGFGGGAKVNSGGGAKGYSGGFGGGAKGFSGGFGGGAKGNSGGGAKGYSGGFGGGAKGFSGAGSKGYSVGGYGMSGGGKY